MIKTIHQELRIIVRAQWSDGGSDLDIASDLYKGDGYNDWYLLDDLNESGHAFNLGINSGIIARGPDPDIPGDAGFSMQLDFTNASFPAPAKVKFRVITVDDETGEPIGIGELVVIDLQTRTDAPQTYTATVPAEFQHRTIGDTFLYVGRTYPLG
jgi:hypothetical protein